VFVFQMLTAVDRPAAVYFIYFLSQMAFNYSVSLSAKLYACVQRVRLSSAFKCKLLRDRIDYFIRLYLCK